MIEAINEAIIKGLKGGNAHNDPLIILKGLTPEIARKKPTQINHSCWELLYHTIIWNDIFINNIKGNVQNWDPVDNWPTSKETEDDENFYILVQRFEGNLQEIKNLLQSSVIDFNESKKLPTTMNNELSTIKLFIAVVQHISYHTGQIAYVRRIVDNWPAK